MDERCKLIWQLMSTILMTCTRFNWTNFVHFRGRTTMPKIGSVRALWMDTVDWQTMLLTSSDDYLNEKIHLTGHSIKTQLGYITACD